MPRPDLPEQDEPVRSATAGDSPAVAAAHGNRLLLLALFTSAILWNVPYGNYVLYPFKLLATWLHEGSHGLAMLITGAGFDRMEVYRDTSGLAFAKAGVGTAGRSLIASAGYVGTALFGALLLVQGRTVRGSRVVLIAVGALLVLSVALFVRNGFGAAALGLLGVTIGLIGWKASESVAGFIVNLFAAQSCINAVLDIRVLFSSTLLVNGKPTGSSDAHTLSSLLGGPPWLWASLWLALSFAAFYLALRYTRLRADAPAVTRD